MTDRLADNHGLIIERRMIVKGWKVEGSVSGRNPERKVFVSYHPHVTDHSLAAERARIGEEGLPDWQPHITEVTVEERAVTPWRQTDV